MMRARTRHTVALGLAAVTVAFALPGASAGAAGPGASRAVVSSLPRSDYTVRPVCPAPAPGEAACMALELVAITARARAHTHPVGVQRAVTQPAPSPAAGDFGLTPEEVHTAYGLPTQAPQPQTIAIVDAYNDVNAEEDLATYDQELGLPACTTANECFKQVNQIGETGNLPFPQTKGELEAARKAAPEHAEEAAGWALEISLDIETAHAVCQNCHVVLVEADTPFYEDLDTAENTAVALGADEISNSWGGPECIEGKCLSDNAAFNHPGVVITASAGDNGYLNWLAEPQAPAANFPASSPHVLAVGGTRLNLGLSGEWTGETVWNDGGEENGEKDGYGAAGGGCSAGFQAPAWQLSLADWSAVGCEQRRAVADIAADADPFTGLAVFDSEGVGAGEDWGRVGGTSLASPLIASAFALAGGAHGVSYPARTLYENAVASPASLHDVTSGSNGECLLPFGEKEAGMAACTPAEQAQASCLSQAICQARAGYDGPTGVGTPDGIAGFAPTGATAESSEGQGPGAGTTSGANGSASPLSAGGSPSAPAGSHPAAVGAPRVVRLTGLSLTFGALLALNNSRPRTSQLAFGFVVNVAARVRAALSRKVKLHGRSRWLAVGRPLSIAAVGGRNSRRFGGRSVLHAGMYRLTAVPAHGAGRSIVFTIG